MEKVGGYIYIYIYITRYLHNYLAPRQLSFFAITGFSRKWLTHIVYGTKRARPKTVVGMLATAVFVCSWCFRIYF